MSVSEYKYVKVINEDRATTKLWKYDGHDWWKRTNNRWVFHSTGETFEAYCSRMVAIKNKIFILNSQDIFLELL